MFQQEWKDLLHNKILLVVILAILTIPAIYTTLFLGSMWDPYGNTNHLPVAVVNEDQPVTYQKESLQIGADLVADLKDSNALSFHFVSRSKAESGLQNGSYYMALFIPKDFSRQATTLMEQNPQKMHLHYELNPRTNYIASKMSETALAKIREQIADEVTKVYAKSVFQQFSTVHNSLLLASDGSKALETGLRKLNDGNTSLSNHLTMLAHRSGDFANGSSAFETALQKYTNALDSLHNGALQLDNGIQKMATDMTPAVKKLSSSAKTLSDGLIAYRHGMQTANTAFAKLHDNSQSLRDGVEQVSSSVQTLQNASESLTNGLTQFSETLRQKTPSQKTLQQLTQALQNTASMQSAQGISKESQAALGTLLQQSAQTIQALSTALQTTQSTIDETILPGSKQLQTGLSQLQAGLLSKQGLLNGVTAYTNGVTQIHQGAEQLIASSPALEQGVLDFATGITTFDNTLHTGMAKLQIGSRALANGTTKLIQKNPVLLQGAKQLASSAIQLQKGSHALQQGSARLQNGIQQLETGSKTLHQKLQNGAEKTKHTKLSHASADMFATPVIANEKFLSTVPNNGHAMAPYMMSVALWVGCIAFCIMYPLTQYHTTLTSSFAWWFSKASVLYPIALLQAVIMVFSLQHFNHFSPLSLSKTLLIACLASFSFMSIMYFFNVALGKAGSFLMLIFMVVQLAGSAGTYPVELSGHFVAKIHRYLPFTYTVNAFRCAISNAGSIHPAITLLTILWILFTLLTILVFLRRTKRIQQGKPTLLAFLEEKGIA